MELRAALISKLREIPDFPTPGVMFYDITPVLQDAGLFSDSIDAMADAFRAEHVQKVVGIDARGFLLAGPVAYLLKSGLAIVRKKGKLPSEIIREHHELEYGRSSLEMHTDAIQKGERVVIVDDVLATGGTARAALRLVENLGGVVVGLGFLLELEKFDGRKKLAGGHTIFSLLRRC